MKNAHSGPAVLSAGIEARTWNGVPIHRREVDGFVNATAMCRAGGKHLPHYLSNDRTAEYLQALSGSLGFPTDLLRVTIRSGPNHLRGTWIHPRLAVDLARWISPALAVWMDGWLLEALGVVAAPPAPQPAPRPQPTPKAPAAAPSATVELLSNDWMRGFAPVLQSLLVQREHGSDEANGLIRAFAHHLLLSCDPLPPAAAVQHGFDWWLALMQAQSNNEYDRRAGEERLIRLGAMG